MMSMRKPGGALICTSPEGEKVRDTFTCGHCGAGPIVVSEKERAEDIGGLCKLCMRLICAACVDRGVCDPFEKKLERAEASYHARRSYDLAS